jgi:hypothetical protein
MNVILMMHKIDAIPNPMIGEAALPDFGFSTDDTTEFMGVRTLDKLDRTLDGYVDLGSQQEMNVFRHDDESVQFISALAAMSVERLQKEPDVRFNDKQFPAVVRREGYEITSRRRDESSRLQGETLAAGSRASLETLNRHEWNSCPSRLFFVRELSFWETRVGFSSDAKRA